MFPMAVSRVYGGVILEGNGVTPDIEVARSLELILDGVDAQLEAAQEYLLERIGG